MTPDAMIQWVVAVLTAINGWQLLQLYNMNREMGAIIARLDRMASNTDSEKEVRAEINSVILKKLGVKDADITNLTKPKNGH